MKKSILLIILIISGFIGFAQLEVKEGSFKKVDGFVNINTEKMYDDNDKPYAVLKIKTENINDKQRRELGFGGDAQTFFEVEYKDGEVWLYISYYATFLKISHPDLSSTEFWFPYDMEPKRGYELTLVNKPSVDEEKIISLIDERLGNSSDNVKEYGYIIIKTTPVDGATVYIDGKEMEMKTPFVSDKVDIGAHKIQVIKNGYQDYVTAFKLEKDEIKKLDIKLEYYDEIKTTTEKIPAKNVQQKSLRKEGIVFKPDFGIGYYGQINYMLPLFINIGYQFNYCYLGFGSGTTDCLGNVSAYPLYLNARFYFLDRTINPYLDIKAGYEFSNYISIWDDEVCKAQGYILGFQIGIEYKHSDFGFVCYIFNIDQYNSNYVYIFSNIGYYALALKYGYNFYNIFKKTH